MDQEPTMLHREDDGLILVACAGLDEWNKARILAGMAAIRTPCVEAAVQYPGLLSVTCPRRTCMCPLNTVCGDFSVQTLRFHIPPNDTYGVLVDIRPEAPEAPQARKNDMLSLASKILGESHGRSTD